MGLPHVCDANGHVGWKSDRKSFWHRREYQKICELPLFCEIIHGLPLHLQLQVKRYKKPLIRNWYCSLLSFQNKHRTTPSRKIWSPGTRMSIEGSRNAYLSHRFSLCSQTDCCDRLEWHNLSRESRSIKPKLTKICSCKCSMCKCISIPLMLETKRGWSLSKMLRQKSYQNLKKLAVFHFYFC